METIQIQLPPALVRQIHRELSSDEVPSQIVVEAIQMWLERRQETKAERAQILQTLRRAGVVMTSQRQRATAKAMLASLPLEKPPSRAQVEALLTGLKAPLSAEIIAMRGER